MAATVHRAFLFAALAASSQAVRCFLVLILLADAADGGGWLIGKHPPWDGPPAEVFDGELWRRVVVAVVREEGTSRDAHDEDGGRGQHWGQLILLLAWRSSADTVSASSTWLVHFSRTGTIDRISSSVGEE